MRFELVLKNEIERSTAISLNEELPFISGENNGYFLGWNRDTIGINYAVCQQDCLDKNNWSKGGYGGGDLGSLIMFIGLTHTRIDNLGNYWVSHKTFEEGSTIVITDDIRIYNQRSQLINTFDILNGPLSIVGVKTAYETKNGFGWLMGSKESTNRLIALEWDRNSNIFSTFEIDTNNMLSGIPEAKGIIPINQYYINGELRIAYLVRVSEETEEETIFNQNLHFSSYGFNDTAMEYTNIMPRKSYSYSVENSDLFNTWGYSNMIDGNLQLVDQELESVSFITDIWSDESSPLIATLSQDFFNHSELEIVLKKTECGSFLTYISEASSKYYINTRNCGESPIENPNSISLSAPSIVDPYLDNNFSIALNINSEAPLFGTEISCTFTNNHLQITNYAYVNWADNVLQVPMSFDAQAGTWSGAQSLIVGENPLIGEIAFTAFDLLTDMTTATWNMSCSGLGSDELANPIPLQSNSISIQIDDGIHGGSSIISGTISIPGQTDNAGVTVSISINDREVQITTDASGAFSFEALREGSFTVHVVHDQFVAACNTLELIEGGVLEPISIDMIPGDINSDGIIDIGDFTFLSGRFGLDSSSIEYDNKADLNDDDIINILDLTLLGSHFGSEQCNTSL